MRVVIQQADLDTCMTAVVLGIGNDDHVSVAVGEASAGDLSDPDVVCIEAGGSGRTDLNNFDHHGIGAPTDSACVQSWVRVDGVSDELRRLVQYVACVDGTDAIGPRRPARPGLTLSSMFSGMRLCTPDPVAQFRTGVALIREVLRLGLDPVQPMPELQAWLPYFAKKRQEWAGIQAARDGVEKFVTASGLRAGFIETSYVGALGLLYGEGCDVGIAYSRRYQAPSGIGSVAKFSIGCHAGLRVDHLLARLNELEPGWGGPSHGTVIGSPRHGSVLVPAEVRRVVAST